MSDLTSKADGDVNGEEAKRDGKDVYIDYDLHVNYILALETKTKEPDVLYFSDHKRLSGVYWAVCSLHLMGRQSALPAPRILQYVRSCRRENGSYGGNSDQDGHLLYTLSALQVHALYDAQLGAEDASATAAWVAGLQNEDGSFAGDEWGEVDTRFTYCALACLKLLGKAALVDTALAADFVQSCVNFDGAYGCIPGAESHAGNTFCSVGALALAGALDRVDKDALGWWLCERQLPSGGLNGRPDKKEDACYSWWVQSVLCMIRRQHWIDCNALAGFILTCQDLEEGGISDRPENIADVFHTFFGLGGLALMGKAGLAPVDPVLALPVTVMDQVAKWNENNLLSK